MFERAIQRTIEPKIADGSESGRAAMPKLDQARQSLADTLTQRLEVQHGASRKKRVDQPAVERVAKAMPLHGARRFRLATAPEVAPAGRRVNASLRRAETARRSGKSFLLHLL